MNVTQINEFSDKCTFCAACGASCPSDAITMTPDNDGFFYPTVSNEKCTDCGICVRACLIDSNASAAPTADRKIYWCYTNDKRSRKKSSSGGVFYTLAKQIIAEGGVVFGAASQGRAIVEHIMAESLEDVEKLMGSKYVQSRTQSALIQASKQLKAGRKVLFAGTPCQVSGLKNYLSRDYENLFTMDFVCHGVPSPKLCDEMARQGSVSPPVRITFREKDKGWRQMITKIYRENGKTDFEYNAQSFYYLSFLYSFSLRKSCYSCHFPTTHCADLTVGDYWVTDICDDRGVSFILPNTQKGINLFENVKQHLTVGELDRSKLDACFINHDEVASYNRRLRDEFYEYYRENGYAELNDKYMSGKLSGYVRSDRVLAQEKIVILLKKAGIRRQH